MARKKPGKTGAGTVKDGFVYLGSEWSSRIPGYDTMPPFLMNIVNDSDLWLFVASNSGVKKVVVWPAGGDG